MPLAASATPALAGRELAVPDPFAGALRSTMQVELVTSMLDDTTCRVSPHMIDNRGKHPRETEPSKTSTAEIAQPRAGRTH